jgi:lysophospholipase L1-like esterase
VPAVKRGKDSFEVVYRQAFPVDAVIIALGTNDIKAKYDIDTNDIIVDLLWYVDQLESLTDYNGNSISPKVLFLLPPKFDQAKFEGSEEKRQELNKSIQASGYESVLVEEVDLTEDGVHFSEKGHQQVAEAVRVKLKELGL